MKRFGRRLAVGAIVLVNIFAFALPAGAAKPAAGGGGGSTVGVKIAAWDKTSGTWNKGNISGYAEQQVIPYHLQIDGGSSPTTVTSVQLQFDNFRTAPGIADFVNPAYLRSYSTNPGQVFYYCTGVGTAPVSDGDATPGFPGAASANCQTVPVFPTDPGSPPSGAYAVGPTFATVSGVRVGTYTWHNVLVPANTTITLLWGAWLALGSHAYQGSALHVAIGNATVNGGTVSFGAKDVPIPVNQIIATSTDKKINGSDNPASVPVGTIVHVSITTQTFGPRSGTQDITIEDDLPPCMSYQDNASPAPSSVTTDASGTVITWSFPGTSNGSTLTVTFDAKAETPGNCTNLAITHSSIAPDTQDTVTLPITGLADLTISKTCPPASTPNAVVTHTIDFSNQGTADAAGVTISDVLGAGLTYQANTATLSTDGGVTSSPITPTVTPGPNGTTTLTFNIGSLPKGATYEIQYDVKVASSFTAGSQGLTDTARISTTSAHSTAHSDTAVCTTTVTFEPDLFLNKKCPAAPSVNTTVQHELDFGNDTTTGSATATGVTISDTLDQGLTYANTATMTINGVSKPLTVTGPVTNPDGSTTVTFSGIPNLAVGDVGVILYNVTVTKTGELTDTATIHENQTDANLADNTDSCTSGVTFVDVFVTKTCPASAQPGDTVTHSLDFGNNGNVTANGVTIDDVLGSGLSYVPNSATLTVGTTTTSITPTVTHNANGTTTLTFSLGNLAGNSTGSISYKVTVPATATSAGSKSFSDQATIHTTSTDSNTANNTSDACVTTVDYEPALHVSKSACPTTGVPGGLLTYTINYSNTGSAPAASAVLRDDIPAGTQVADAAGGTVSPDGRSVTWDLGDLGVGATGSKTLIVLVTAENGTLLVNNVSLTSGSHTATFRLQTPVSNAGALTHGSAYNVNVDLLGSTLIDKLGNVSTVAPGTPQTAAQTAIPVNIPGVLTVGVLNTGSVSSVTNFATTTSYANVAGFPNSANPHGLELLGGAITANAVHGVSHSFAGPFTATNDSLGSSFVDLRINGNQFCLNPTPDPTCANIAPNTTVDVTLPGSPSIVVARAVLYEKSGTASLGTNGKNSASQTVNMIHVTLLKPFGPLPAGAEIIVSHADSDATYPSGFACGTTPSTVSGNAYTAFAQGTIGSPPAIVATGQIGDAELPITGGSDSDTTTAQVPGVVTSQTAQNTTSGMLGPYPQATSESKVQYVNLLGGVITANLLDVSSASSATGSSAGTTFGSTFLNLTINGTPIAGTPDPNTIIAIPPSQTPDGTLIFIILNEQIPSSDGTKNTQGDVNAIHVWVLKGQAIQLEVVVAHAHSDAHHS